jgi:hypothetical protein
MILNKINCSRLVAAPQSIELIVKTIRDKSRYRFLPINLANQPLIGITTAFATIYEVRTHVTSSCPADRLP